jgi:hypothetical protein
MGGFPVAALDTITVEFPRQEAFRRVGRLVAGGVAARADLPVERIEDLGLAYDALCMRDLSGDATRVDLVVDDGALWMSLGPFGTDPLSDRAVARVVSPLVDWVGVEEDPVEGIRVVVRLALAAGGER